jgi:hypothetical protein
MKQQTEKKAHARAVERVEAAERSRRDGEEW